MSKASAYFTVGGLDDRHDTKELKLALNRIHSVSSVSISGQSVAVDFDTIGADCGQIQKAIEKLGYGVSDCRLETHLT